MSRGIDWLFRNRVTGEITVAQAPNPPLVVALVAGMLRWVLTPEGRPLTALNVVMGGALAWWAADELLRGVNPFRRMLGAAVLAGLGVNLVR